VRLPGDRRRAIAARARSEGVDVPEALFAQLERLAA